MPTTDARMMQDAFLAALVDPPELRDYPLEAFVRAEEAVRRDDLV